VGSRCVYLGSQGIGLRTHNNALCVGVACDSCSLLPPPHFAPAPWILIDETRLHACTCTRTRLAPAGAGGQSWHCQGHTSGTSSAAPRHARRRVCPLKCHGSRVVFNIFFAGFVAQPPKRLQNPEPKTPSPRITRSTWIFRNRLKNPSSKITRNTEMFQLRHQLRRHRRCHQTVRPNDTQNTDVAAAPPFLTCFLPGVLRSASNAVASKPRAPGLHAVHGYFGCATSYAATEDVVKWYALLFNPFEYDHSMAFSRCLATAREQQFQEAKGGGGGGALAL